MYTADAKLTLAILLIGAENIYFLYSSGLTV
jgi:hypothetical protein